MLDQAREESVTSAKIHFARHLNKVEISLFSGDSSQYPVPTGGALWWGLVLAAASVEHDVAIPNQLWVIKGD